MEEFVVVYTGNNCTYCDRAKQFLTENGVSFKERNIANDTSLFNEFREKFPDALGVPVIQIGDDITLYGFNATKLRDALKEVVDL